MSRSTETTQTLRVLIADDEPPARRRLAAMVDRLAAYQLCGEAENGQQAVEQSQALQPDIALLDIRMPGMDGLQAAALIAEQSSPPAVIFSTAYDEHALAAFQAGAIDYLLKPIKREQLEAALQKAHQLNRAQLSQLQDVAAPKPPQTVQEEVLWIRTRTGTERIDVADVRAFVADQKYVSAYLPGREVIVDDSLKALEQRFGHALLRVHRNALVSRSHLEALEDPARPSEVHRVRLNQVDVKPQVSRRLLPALRSVLKERRRLK